MCDYSLEVYRSRPARVGERYVSNRFPSGTIGFVAPGDQSVAICMECGMQIALSNLPNRLREQAQVGEAEVVTFTRIEEALHHDAIRFDNGYVASLQDLGEDVSAGLCGPTPSMGEEKTFASKIKELLTV
jgi:hypothetical protein